MITHQLIKQTMLKYTHILIIFSLLLISFSFASCGDDNKDDMDTSKTYIVRYEASCDNPDVALRILYSTKNTDFQNVENDAKEVFVKSPFSVELEMKKREFCYISAQANDSQDIDENAIFSTSIFTDGVKKTENSNKTVSISYLVLGIK